MRDRLQLHAPRGKNPCTEGRSRARRGRGARRPIAAPAQLAAAAARPREFEVAPVAAVDSTGDLPPAAGFDSTAELGPSAAARLRQRLVVVVILATATGTLVLAVPPLHHVAGQIAHMNLLWVGGALVLEIASCSAYVVVFRLFFDQVPAGTARKLAWTEEASGALLPTGGVGALAIGGWLLRQAGMSTAQIIERSSALFFLTSASNVTLLVVGGTLLATGGFGGTDTLLLAAGPVLLGAGATAATLALPVIVRRTPHYAWPAWLLQVTAGIEGARHALIHPSWRVLGAAGYLGFDIAALGATFAATGHPIPIVTLVLGYIIGYIANMLPVPGGFGVLEAGLAGTLILYGAPPTQAAAAAIVYHAIAFWIPSIGGIVGYAQLRGRPRSLELAARVSPGLRTFAQQS
jgi:uncharacterized membrane protein YbhN (UPF0104 family)